MFAKVMVDYYGTLTPVNQLASFASPEARMMIVTPYDKGSLTEIEKAIRDSDLGVNPTSDGTIIRVSLPTLTEERRKEYIKMAKHTGEEGRIAVRNIRRHAKDAIERLVKDGEVGEDDGSRGEKELESLTRRYVEAIDDALKHKEAELLEV
jgi:ribosome recycling factor